MGTVSGNRSAIAVSALPRAIQLFLVMLPAVLLFVLAAAVSSANANLAPNEPAETTTPPEITRTAFSGLAQADNSVLDTWRPFASGADLTYSLLAADLNGDGALDLVLSNAWLGAGPQQSAAYLNDGKGNFYYGPTTCAASPATLRCFGTGTDQATSMAVGDVNGDSALDLIMGNYQLQNAVFLNDGQGNFYNDAFDCATSPGNVRCFGSGTDKTRSVVTGDLNGDGWLDLVVGNEGEPNAVYLNDGTGHFPNTSAYTRTVGTGTDTTTSIVLGDMNGDNAIDVVVGNTNEQNVVYLNDGTGTFSNTIGYTRTFGTGTDNTYALAVGDLNSDGALDITAGNHGEQSVAYLNDGAGNFYAGPVNCNALPSNVRCVGTSSDGTRVVAVADLNGDGALDVVFGRESSQQNVVYLNDGIGNFNSGALNCGLSTILCFGTGSDNTFGMAVADLNGDQALDVAIGSNFAQSVVFFNHGAGRFNLSSGARNFGAITDTTVSTLVGDINRDGALDLIAGNGGAVFGTGEQNVVYLNDGVGNFFSGQVNCALPSLLRCFGTGTDKTRNVAVADLNGDGWLDLATGTGNEGGGEQNVVYLNDGSGNFLNTNPYTRPFGTGSDRTFSVLTGDMNGDGSLDLVVGNFDEQNAVYVNDGTGNFYSGPLNCAAPSANVRCFGTGSDSTQSVAVGDVNGDGALDIAVGNGWFVSGRQNALYLNDGAGNFYNGLLDCTAPPSNVRCFGNGSDTTFSVAFGDMNGDGALDIVAGNDHQPNAVYLNDGTSHFPGTNSHYFGTGNDRSRSVLPADINGDGALDIVVGNTSDQNVIYLNDGAGNFSAARPFGTGTDQTWQVAVGDLNGDAALDLAVGNDGQQNVAYLNGLGRTARLVNNPPRIRTTRPVSAANANFFSTPQIISNVTIPITYTLSDPEGDPVRFIRAYYSPDGGGKWYAALAADGTITSNLTTAISGTMHVFNWDVFRSGFFGKSDNVVFRIEAYPGLTTRPNGVQVFQYPYASDTTFPFRVRGTQVRVLSDTVPVANAVVYRLPARQSLGAQPLANTGGQSFRTDEQGYLQGRGQLGLGDQLVALYPVSSTGSYTLYYTSATPTVNGLDMHTVVTPGVQTLVVSSHNPLLLFDLDVSLEWDARQDATTLNRLQFDLQRASELVYDWTDGQAALAHIHLYQAGEHWNDANVRVFATNHLRPNASQGGVVSNALSEVINTSITTTQVITYEPGQIRMAVNWNRYGDPSGPIGDDWARAFAHELGHYLFFQDDNYLGYNVAGNFVAVTSCPSAMSDPYSGDKASGYDEFHPRTNWTTPCANTLANRETGRSDWETLKRFYPALNETLVTTATTWGPSSLPLAVTQIEVKPVASSALTVPLLSPIYSLVRAEGGSYAPQRASAYLFQDIDQDGVVNRMVELGSPVSGKVEARGARAGDRLCVFDPETKRLGCDVLNVVKRTLALTARPDWSPAVLITPVTSRTIQVSVSGITQTVLMWAQLFPRDGNASGVISLTQAGAANTYSGAFKLDSEALEASVHIWIDESGARRETLTSYSIGGNPVPRRPGTGSRHFPPRRFRRAPVLSSDGQAQVLGIQGNFPIGEFYALQTVDNFPAPPSWTTIVGQAYRLVKSNGAPSIAGSSFVINYLDNEVPFGEESSLTIYFLPGCGSSGAGQPPVLGSYRIFLPLVMQGGTQTCNPTWRALPTTRDAEGDLVSAQTAGEGLYLVLSSIDIPLQQGWNNIAYPVAEARPVNVALASIAGQYTTVCSFQATDVDNPWHCFGTGMPPFGGNWINDLATLEFGTYWIYAMQAVTLSLKGPLGYASINQPDQADAERPPAIFYGEVKSTARFIAQPGMVVTAKMGDAICGQAKTIGAGGITRYVIDVRAVAKGGDAACGQVDGAIAFSIDGQVMSPVATWNNAQMWPLILSPER